MDARPNKALAGDCNDGMMLSVTSYRRVLSMQMGWCNSLDAKYGVGLGQ